MRGKDGIEKNKDTKKIARKFGLIIFGVMVVIVILMITPKAKGEYEDWNRPWDFGNGIWGDGIYKNNATDGAWVIMQGELDFKDKFSNCTEIIIASPPGGGGGIIVSNGAKIIFDNIDLTIESDTLIPSEITVEGTFEFEDTVDGEAYITAADLSKPYKFNAGGTTVLKNARIQYLWGSETGFPGGIVVNSNNVEISNCVIEYCVKEAINCTNRNLDIKYTDIKNNEIGIVISDTNKITAKYVNISDNDIGIIFYDASPTLNNINILNSDYNATEMYDSSPIFENCSIKYTNFYYDFSLHGVSRPKAVATPFDGYNYFEFFSELTVQWFINLTTLVENTNDIVPKADVTIKDIDNEIESTYVTDLNGKKRWIKVIEYVESLTGKNPKSPHIIEAKKFGVTGQKEVDIQIQQNRTSHIIYIPIPDLTLSGDDITFLIDNNVTMQGENIDVKALIKNVGKSDANCNVDFYYYDENNPNNKNSIGTANIDVPGEGDMHGIVSWDIGTIDVGYYYIYVEIKDSDPSEINEGNNSASSSNTIRIITRPDLNFTKWQSKEDIIISEHKPVEGNKVTMSATVHNIGDANASCTVNFTYKPKGGGEFTSFAKKNIDVNGQLYGNNEKNTGDVELNTTSLHGEYIIRVIIENVRPSEFVKDNNIIEDFIYVYSKPDLNFTDWDKKDINISDDEPMEGDNVLINATVHNLGETNATCTVEFKYKPIGDEYTIIGTKNIEVKGISWGKTYTTTTDLNWDTTGLYGWYVLNVTIKNSNPKESNKNNNFYEHLIRVYSRPDLNFTNWKTKEDFKISDHMPNEGDVISMNVTVQNLGEIKCNDCNVTFYYKKEGTNDQYTEIGSKHISIDGNMSGKNKTVTENVTWNTAGHRGWYIIKALIHDSSPGERITDNNEIFDKIYIVGKPEMIVNKITFSKYDPLKDEKIEIIALIENLGDRDAENFNVTFYDNEIKKANEIDSLTTSLSGHSKANVSVEWTIPSEGDHIIWAEITNVQNESNPNNNIKNATIHVNTHPDLKLNYENNITFSNNVPNEDESIVIYANITNIGDANGTATIKFYDGEPSGGNLIGKIENVLVNGSYYKKNFGINNVTMVNVQWDLTGIFGKHKICVKIENVIPSDSQPQNNIGYVTIIINDRPNADNLSASQKEVYRTNTVKIYANATDTDDNEEDLTVEIVYRVSDNAQWENEYLGVPKYIGDHWEVEFTPKKDAKLGKYDFGINFTDTKGAKSLDWLIINDLVEVKNNPPKIIGVIPDKSAKEDVNIIFNLSDNKKDADIEDDDADLVWSAEYDDEVIEYVIVNNDIITIVPIENNTKNKAQIQTDVLIILTDTDGGTDSQYVVLTWTQILDPPAVYVNAPSSVYRTQTIYIYINGSDAESDEKDLNCTLKYKNATSNWINLSVEWIDSKSYWSAKLNTNKTMDTGNLTFNITMKDPDGNVTNKLFNVNVKNNLPIPSLTSNAPNVYRTNAILFYVNGTDVENSEENLTCNVKYKKPGGDWEDTYLGSLIWNSTEYYWNITFSPPKDASIGNYEVKAELTDLDGGKNSTTIIIEVKNNLPVIVGKIPNLGPVEEENDIIFDFTDYESDIEDVGIKLDWYAGTYNNTEIASISGERSNNDELTFTPAVNFSGTAKLEIVLIDDDGGTDSQIINLTWTNVNDPPYIKNATIENTIAYTNDTLIAKANGWKDADGDKEGYQYEWQKYNETNGKWEVIDGQYNKTLDGKVFFDKHDKIRVKITPDDGNATNNLGYPRVSEPIEISNSLPTIKSVQITATTDPNDANETSIFTAKPIGYHDDDGDSSSGYRYVWKNEDGDILLDGYGENKLNGTKFDKGDKIYCEIRAFDGEDEGNAVASAVKLIHNSPPRIKRATFENATVHINETLTAIAIGWYDVDGDSANYNFEWWRKSPNGDWEKIVNIKQYLKLLSERPSFYKGVEIKVVITPDDLDNEYNIGEPKNATITISNTPPEITNLYITPSIAYTNDTLVANVKYHDADRGDNRDKNITFYYQWQRWNETSEKFEDIGGQTAKTLDGFGDNFSKNDIIRVLATPNDKTDNGTTVASATIKINNTAPEITEISITPKHAYTNDTLKAIVKSHDDDNDTVFYFYQWQSFKWGTWDNLTGETNKTLEPSKFSREDKKIRVLIIPYDGTNYGDQKISQELIIENTPPEIKSVEIIPKQAYTNDTLAAFVSSWDDDGDDITYYYQWQRNESGTWENLTGQTAMNLDGFGNNFSKHDEIRVIVTPNDGIENGTEFISDSIVILNTPPTIAKVIIEPKSKAYTDTDLKAVIYGEHDDDNDTIVHYYYNWTNKYGKVLLEGIGKNVLNSTLFYKDDRLWCNVSAFDGEEYGELVQSNSKYIWNTPAKITGVNITHNSKEISEARVNWTIKALPIGWFDKDNDNEDYIYSWNKNKIGNEVGIEETLFLDDREFKKGDKIILVVTPNDHNTTDFAELEANEMNISITIVNTPPTIESVTLTSNPANATKTSTLIAKIINAHDNDTDSITFSYTWKNNGVNIIGAPNSNTLNGTYFNKGDVISVEVAPFDGENYGIEVESNTITIGNTAPIITNVIINPEPAYNHTDLIAIPSGFEDIDNDIEGYAYEWQIKNESQGSFVKISNANKNILESKNFDRGDVVKVICWPYDGTWHGLPKEYEITISNSKPIIGSVILTSDTEVARENSVLTASIIKPEDEDNDKIKFKYVWMNKGMAIAGSDGETYDTIIRLTGEYFNKHDDIYVTVTPNDGIEDGNAVESNHIEIENTLPVMDSVTIISDTTTPTKKSTLTAIVKAHDDDNDTITYLYEWYKNSKIIEEVDSNTLIFKYFEHFDKIYVNVTPFDDESNGSVMKSNITIEIENTPPRIESVTIYVEPIQKTKDTAKEGCVLTAEVNNAKDDDGDEISYIYKWKSHGAVIKKASASSNTLTSEFFKKGDLITVTIIPKDIYEYGVAVDSTNSISIVNTKPTITGAEITLNGKKIAEAHKGDTLTAEAYGWKDADGDDEGYKYQWQRLENKVWEDIKGAYVQDFSAFSKGDKIRVIIKPWDGDETGEEIISPEVTIVNTKPDVEIAYPKNNEVFKIGKDIDFVGDAVDIDGDKLNYSWSTKKGIIGEGKTIKINSIEKYEKQLLVKGEQNVILEVYDGEAKVETNVTIVLKGEDLEIIDIKFEGEIREGKTINIIAKVDNIGNLFANKVKVKFFYGENLLGEDIISNITAGGSGEAILEWIVEKMKGNQTIKAVVDPENSIIEFNEKNNELVIPIKVKEKGGFPFVIFIPIILIIIGIILFGIWQIRQKKEAPAPPVVTVPTAVTPPPEETKEPAKLEVIEPIPITPAEEIEKILKEEEVGEEEAFKEELVEEDVDKELEDVDKELEMISKELEELEGGETWETLAELRTKILEEEKEEEEIEELAERRKELLEEEEEEEKLEE